MRVKLIRWEDPASHLSLIYIIIYLSSPSLSSLPLFYLSPSVQVLYIYEVHTAAAARRTGIGRRLIEVMMRCT